MHSPIGQQAIKDYPLAIDCARHAQLFFNNTDLNLKNARPGSFSLMPTLAMQQTLKRDYQAMAGMIFGDIPSFTEVLEAINTLEIHINTALSMGKID